jgi:hypothetical protein
VVLRRLDGAGHLPRNGATHVVVTVCVCMCVSCADLLHVTLYAQVTLCDVTSNYSVSLLAGGAPCITFPPTPAPTVCGVVRALLVAIDVSALCGVL